MSSGNETDPLLKVRMVQGQVDEVTAIMHSNIEKVIERGDRIDSLQMKAESLQDNASMFKKQAVSTRKHFQWQNYKLTIIITIVILCILAAIIVPIVLKYT